MRIRRAPAPFPKKPREHQFEYWVNGYRRGYIPWPANERITVDVAKDIYARFEAACARHHLTMRGELAAFIERRTAELENAT